MIYRNALKPSTRFGLVLLVFATAGTLVWLGLLLDEDAGAFDGFGLVVLGLDMIFLMLSVLFFCRVPWARTVTLIVLHLITFGAVALGVAAVWEREGVGPRVVTVGLTTLAAGLPLIGILTLYSNDMCCDLASSLEFQKAAVRRRTLRSIAVAVAGFTIAGILCLAWHVVPLLRAKPTISVDYLARANELSLPANYEPDLNAAPHYEKLFADFVPLPRELEEHWKAWPGDLTPDQRGAMEQWASLAAPSRAALAAVARCPYWWFELTSDEGSLCKITIPYQEQMRSLTWALVFLAKYEASQGRVEDALELLVNIHAMGFHRSQGGALVEQMSGLAIGQLCYDALLTVLDRCTVDVDTLRRTLEILEARLPVLCVPRFGEIERLYGYDSIQRLFSDDGQDNGRLIPGKLHATKKNGGLYSPPLSYLDALWICTTHPGRAETVRLFDQYWREISALAEQTPWHLFSRGSSYEERLDTLLASNYFLRSGARATAGCIRLGWQGRTYGRAVVTILAILARKAENGQWPPSLAALVAEGYLQQVPIDPYSDASLIYKVTDSDFILYSVAENFMDNGGFALAWNESALWGDWVFWPVDSDDEPLTGGEP